MHSSAIEFDLSPNLINDLYIRMIDSMIDTEVAEFQNAKNYSIKYRNFALFVN